MIGDAGGFHRFGLGPRPGDLESFPNIRDAIRAEADLDSIATINGPGLLSVGDALMELAADRERQRELQAQQAAAARAEEAAGEGAARMAPADDPPAMRQPPAQQRIYLTEFGARLRKYQTVDIGFVERLVAFWTNHFAVEAGSGLVERTLVGVFEREAVRPHALGRFRDMLGAATKHPAMLVYLDNAQSIGPNSIQGARAGTGLNENHARELLELHTLGVDAGYTQADVTEMARILTGWAFVGRQGQGDIGAFSFRAIAHEPGDRTVLGDVYPAGGVEQGEGVLDVLAEHPATARHIAFKLVRHFVADEPDPAFVDRLAGVFLDTGGDLKALSLAMIDSDEAFVEATKIKTPQLFSWSAFRALRLSVEPQQVVPGLQALGQPMWDPPSPQGFSDESATWLAPDAMTSRLDIAELLAQRAQLDISPRFLFDMILGPDASYDSRTAVLGAESETQALALLLMTPEFQRI